MISWLARSVQSGLNLLRNRPPWLRTVTRVLSILLIAGAVYYLIRTVRLGVEQVDWRSLELSPGPVVMSLLLTTASSVIGSWTWQLVLKGFGYPIPLRECLRIQTTSNLTKYLPGYAWQLLGKAYLTRKTLVPAMVVTWALFLELGLLLLTGALVGFACMPPGAALPLVGPLPPWLQAVLVAALLLAIILLPVLLRAAGTSRLAPRFSWLVAPQHLRLIWLAAAIMAAAWVVLGIGLDLLIAALDATPAGGMGLGMYSLPLSVVVGLLAPFVPSGIGIREGVMTGILGAYLPGSVAVVLALLSRLVSIAGELGALACYWLMEMAIRCHNRLITRKG